jgi:hypothetical protein
VVEQSRDVARQVANRDRPVEWRGLAGTPHVVRDHGELARRGLQERPPAGAFTTESGDQGREGG